MTSLRIRDTGRLRVRNPAPPVGEKIAPGDTGVAGAWLTLKGVEISFSFETLVNITPQPGKKKKNDDKECWEHGEVDRIGVTFPTWTIRGIFNTKDSDDLRTIGRLIYMMKTKGFKQLSPPLDLARTDLISYSKWGEREADGLTVRTIDSIDVIIQNLAITQKPEANLIEYSFEAVETM